MSSPSQTAAPPSNFKSMLDAALAEYKEKTGDDLLAHRLAADLQKCESVDAVLNILRDQAKTFERSGDQKLMKWIDPLVHVLYTFSGALGDGVSLAFPPAKVIFTGIGVLLAAAKDARASHGAIVNLFERIESFFKRLGVYTQISLTTEMAEVLVKIVIELLSILSIATKEVKRRRAKLFARRLLGRTDIEDALRRLDSLIQEEVQMAIAQTLKVTTEVKDGADKTNVAMQKMSNDMEEVKWTQIEQDIRKWFSPPDPSTNYNIACDAHHEGTAAWFLESTMFKDWMSIGSLLWVHGKPGSGKSVLCSVIIKHVISLRDTGQASLAFFYFDFRDKDKKQDFRNFITSLLVQLSTYSIPCCKIISRIYSTHGKGAQQPSNDTLTNCLREMLSVTEQPIYILVDALDECPDSSGMPTPREVVLKLLEDLVHLGLPKLHICVTSRPETDIKDSLGSLANSAVSLHDQTGQTMDIFNYVSNAVYSDKKMQRWRSGEKELVVAELSKRADGMFRWVFCQLEVLRHCLPASIRQTLDRLPESLDETYLRVLSQIPQANQAHAHRMLQCLVVAVRPLSVEELAELLAFEFDAAHGGIPKYRAAWRLDDQTQAVLSTCSSLVTIVDAPWYHFGYGSGHQVVQFSHFSVKEFLMSDRLTSPLGDFSQYHIHPGPAHIILTQACLGFLLHLDDNIDKKSVKKFPLAEYAARYWVEHAQFGDVASRVKDGMETLFDSDKPHFAAWIAIYDMDKLPMYHPPPGSYYIPTVQLPGSPHYSVKEISPNPNPLYYSALCGFYDLVKHLAIKHPQHVNAICGQYNLPLLAALSKDYVKVAGLLVEHGAHVDAREPTGKTILLKALSIKLSMPPHNVVNIVKFLLKHGSDVNAQDGALKSSLNLADRLEVVQMLLEHRADVNCQDDNGKTPLHLLFERWAKNEGNVLNHARLLLEHGAEANRPDKNNQMPLHLAMEHVWFKLARLFLEHGADANAENNNGETPLDLALDIMLLVVSEGRIREGDVLDFIWLLLEHGAEVNRRGKTHQTPLLLAMERDWFKLALVLLEHGADPNASNNIGKTPLHILSECQIYDKSGVSDVLLNRVGLWRDHGAGRYKGNGTPLLLDIGTGVYKFKYLLDTTIRIPDPLDMDTVWIPPILIDVQDENHTTPSHPESNFGPVETAEAPGPLDQGADTNAWDVGRVSSLYQESEGTYVQNENPLTPLPLAPSYRTWSLDIVPVPLYRGATANSEDNFGRTPLYPVAEGAYSFEQDRVRVAQLLLERGADVNATDENSTTPLHLASCYGRVEIAQVLLDGGATINSKGNQGRTPLHAAAEGGYYSKDIDDVLVAQLLLERGADINMPDDDNQTPLHLASCYGRVEIARVLLDGGATINSKNNQGRTPLHSAAGGGYYSKDIGGVPVAQLLLERGADVNMPDDDNQTPLHLASSLTSYFGRVEMVLVLLNAGANASAKNAKGQTPLHLVSQCPHYSRGDAVGVAQLLLEHGADVNAQDKNHATPSDLASYHGRTEIASMLGHQENDMLLAALDLVPLLSCPTCFTKNH